MERSELKSLLKITMVVFICLLPFAIVALTHLSTSPRVPVPTALLEFSTDPELRVAIFGVIWSPGGLMADGMGLGDIAPIYIVDFDTHRLEPIYINNQLVPGSSASLSPSGELIAFSDYDLRQIRVIRRFPPHQEVLHLPFAGNVVWSPQGDRLAVTDTSEDRISIQIVDLESQERSEVFATDRQTWLSPTEIAWSPDGKKLAFSLTAHSSIENEIQSDILILSLEDGRVFQLTDTPTIREDWPSWSPDSNLLLFILDPITRGVENKMTFASIIGDCEKVIPQPEGIQSAAWSPDGSRIAVATFGGDVQIFEIGSLVPGLTSASEICP